jgi:hypothetical protein
MWRSCLFFSDLVSAPKPWTDFNSTGETFVNSRWHLPVSAVLIHNGLNSTLLKTIKSFCFMNVRKFCKETVSSCNKQERTPFVN